MCRMLCLATVAMPFLLAFRVLCASHAQGADPSSSLKFVNFSAAVLPDKGTYFPLGEREGARVEELHAGGFSRFLFQNPGPMQLQIAADVHSRSDSPKADKVALRKTAVSCILRMAKDGRVQSPVSPVIFATLSRLFEDAEHIVQDSMLKKVYRGTAIEQGKLPFRFTSLFARVVYDSEPTLTERGKNQMRNTLLVMAKHKKSTGSEAVSIMSEHILPWLFYLLVVHKEYVDPDEDATQVSQAFKKNFEFFFNCVPSEEQNAAAMQQLLRHFRKCAVPAGAVGDASPTIVARNIGLAAEVAERILSNKRWATKGFACKETASKIVDASILCEKGKGKEELKERPAELYTGDFAMSPIKASASATKAANKKTARPSKTSSASEIKSPAKSPANLPAKSPAKSPAKRRQSKAASEEADDPQVDDEMHQDADNGDADFDFEVEEPKRKSGASEHDQGRGRRPDSAGQAPARGKKVRCPVMGKCLMRAVA